MRLRNIPLLGSSALLALAAGPFLMVTPASAQSSAGQPYFWSGGRKVPLNASSWVGVQVAPNASGVVTRGLQGESALDTARGALRFNAKNILVLPVSEKANSVQKNALVSRLGRSSSVQSRLKTYSVTKDANALPYVATGEVAVSFRASVSSPAVQNLLKKYGAKVVRSLGPIAPNAVLLSTAQNNAVEVANALYELGATHFSHPHFLVPLEKRGHIDTKAMKAARKMVQGQTGKAASGVAPSANANDPFYPNQWHLNNTGQGGGVAGADVRIEEAWEITKGSPNIIVAVMDDGVDISHEDFGPNKLVPGYDFLDNDSNPSPVESDDDHGTAVAGVAVATGDNALGVSGAAPGCKLMPIRMLGRLSSVVGIADAFRFATQNGADIINNSWGATAPGVPLPDVIKASIDFATTTGRGGKGAVVIFAAGNDSRNSDLDGYPSYERVINVAASTNYDRRAGYSNTGRTLDVAAPSNGGSLGIVTTDRMGALGYSGGNYATDFGGTSSAAPLVAGVAALLLSKEPNLTYVQVRERLQETADKIDLQSGSYDSRGQSNFYGYGRVNAGRLLLGPPAKTTLTAPLDNSAVGGTSVPVRARTANDERVQRVIFDVRPVYGRGVKNNINLAIPDFNFDGVNSALELTGTPRRVLATAEVTLQINHSYVGDLQVTLISPDGTREVVYDHENGGASSITLNKILPLAVRDTTGTYKLEVVDDVQVDSGTLVNWGLILRGDYATIGTQQAAAHRIGEEWGVTWNTSRFANGEYEVRATAITDKQGNFTDTNTGIILSGTVEPRFTVGGKVVDASGRPVAGVLLTRGTENVRTNTQGIYRFTTPLPAGQYEVTASLARSVFTPPSRRVLVVNANVENINFTLSLRDAVAPTVRILAPASANSIVPSVRAVTGTATDNSGGSGIAKVTGTLYRYATLARGAGYFTTNNTYEANPIATLRERPVSTVVAANGSATYTFGMPGLDDGRYRITVQAYDRASNRSIPQSIEFTIDRTAPALRLVRPTNNAVYNLGALTLANGTVTDAGGVVSLAAQFYRYASGTTSAGYWTGSGATYSATARDIRLPVSSVFRFNFPANLPAGRYLVRFIALDRAGNRSQVQATFTLRSSVPVARTTPGSSASSASASIDSAVLNFAGNVPNIPQNFVVTLNGVQIEAESASIVGNRLTIGLPEGAARSGDTITVSWPDLRDLAGRKLAAGSQTLIVR